MTFDKDICHNKLSMWSLDERVTSCCLRNDMQNSTAVILFITFIYIAQRLFYANYISLHCKTSHASKPGRNVSIFYRQDMTPYLNQVTSRLRSFFA